MLHRQEHLGAAGVQPALFAEIGEHLRRFGDGFGLMDGEFSQGHHNEKGKRIKAKGERTLLSFILYPLSFFVVLPATLVLGSRAPGGCARRARGRRRWRYWPPSNSKKPRRRPWRRRGRRRRDSARDAVRFLWADRRIAARDSRGSSRSAVASLDRPVLRTSRYRVPWSRRRCPGLRRGRD